MPIIAYSIRAALDSNMFDEVMVSTDDEEIAAVAISYGAKVPFLRSAETSNDYATTADVITEVLDRYESAGKKFDVVACIYATAPFVTADRLRHAAESIDGSDFDSAFTCVEFSYPILRSLIVNDKGAVAMRWPEYKLSRSQDLPKFYHDAGQFYLSDVKAFRRSNGFWGDNTAPIILSELEVQDLDTPTDWSLAEMKYSLLHQK